MTRRKVAAREPTYLIEDERTVVQLLEFVLKAHRFENLFTVRNILRNFFFHFSCTQISNVLLTARTGLEMISRNKVLPAFIQSSYSPSRVLNFRVSPLRRPSPPLWKVAARSMHEQVHPNTCLSTEKLRGEDELEEKLRNWSYERRAHAESERSSWKLFPSFSSVLF